MKRRCTVCGHVMTGDEAVCPICKAPKTKFEDLPDNVGELVWAATHVVGIAKGVDKEVLEGLREHFVGECTEVGMYLAMARVASREGYPEIAEAYTRIAWEEAEHAAKFGELLGEVVTDSTEKNLQLRVDAEHGACAAKVKISERARSCGLHDIADTVMEMGKDEARHGSAFNGLLTRYFKK